MSTLGDPANIFGNRGMFSDVQQPQEDEITTSHFSTDYDYKRAYGGTGEEISVSTAGGNRSGYGPYGAATPTNDDDYSRQRFGSDASSKVGKSVAGNVSLFSDDDSFEQMYNEEEKFVVAAPPGKLGIVIDKPSNGLPVVHAIKDTSVLADQVRIGDKLISVDDIDTTTMNAIRVSKLISSRADNQRMMVFKRSRNDP